MERQQIQQPATDQEHESSRRDLLRVFGGAGLTALIIGNTSLVSAQNHIQRTITDPVGISMQTMGIGEPGPTPGLELTLRRTTLAVGGHFPSHTNPGSLVIFVEAGLFGYTALGGIAQLTRKAVDGTSAPSESMPLGLELILEPGDWLYSENPHVDFRNAGRVEVTLLVAGLTRIGEPFTTSMGDMDMGPTPTPSPELFAPSRAH